MKKIILILILAIGFINITNGQIFGVVASGQTTSGIVNLITNGTFDSDTDWTKEGTWAIGSGVASATSEGGKIRQNQGFAAGDYKITFEIITVTAGSIAIRINDGTYSSSYNSVGTHIISSYTAPSGSGWFDLDGIGFTGTVDNIIVEAL